MNANCNKNIFWRVFYFTRDVDWENKRLILVKPNLKQVLKHKYPLTYFADRYMLPEEIRGASVFERNYACCMFTTREYILRQSTMWCYHASVTLQDRHWWPQKNDTTWLAKRLSDERLKTVCWGLSCHYKHNEKTGSSGHICVINPSGFLNRGRKKRSLCHLILGIFS